MATLHSVLMQVYYTDVWNNDYNCIKPYTVRHYYHVLWYAKKKKKKQTNKQMKKNTKQKSLVRTKKTWHQWYWDNILHFVAWKKAKNTLYDKRKQIDYKLAGT